MKNPDKFALLIFILIFCACRKDTNTWVICDDPSSTETSTLTIGDTTGMKISKEFIGVKSPNGGQNSTSQNSPVWCQDSSDLKISSNFHDGPGPFNSITVRMESLSTLSFLQVENGFTSYMADDTVYFGSNPTEMRIYQGIDCEPTNPNNPIHKVEDQIIYLDSGSTFSSTDYFSSFASISRGSWGYPPSFFSVENDTQKVIIKRYEYDCHDFDSSTPKYVGFKMNVDGYIKLGWMLIDREPGYPLVIREIAIQK